MKIHPLDFEGKEVSPIEGYVVISDRNRLVGATYRLAEQAWAMSAINETDLFVTTDFEEGARHLCDLDEQKA